MKYTEEEKEQIAEMVEDWLQRHNCSCEEVAQQDDNCITGAVDLVGELANIRDVTKENPLVFLGGTCAGSKWREFLIPLLHIDYYNPVVKEWTKECIKKENEAKLLAKYHLYVITPRMQGVYSIAEAVNSTHLVNVTTIFCILKEDNLGRFTPREMYSLAATKQLIEDNGGIVLDSLQEIADYLNKQ